MSNVTPDTPLPAAETRPVLASDELYRLVRNRIEHEDNLIVQRLSWMVASQSFLFTAYAIVTNGLSNATVPSQNGFVRQLLLLDRLIPVVAISTCVLIDVTIIAAIRAIRELRRNYDRAATGNEVIPIQTSQRTRLLGLSAPVLLPLIFIAVWLVLLAHGPGS